MHRSLARRRAPHRHRQILNLLETSLELQAEVPLIQDAHHLDVVLVKHPASGNGVAGVEMEHIVVELRPQVELVP